MAATRVARYTGSVLEIGLGVVLLGVAAVHAAAGVATAVLPAVGGVALLGGALALAPATRHRVTPPGRSDVAVFAGALATAALCLGVFVAFGRFF